MKTGVDKRIIKTKHAIRCAFRELVQQKEMAEISICELTQKANITRSTFYMYYDSVGAVRDEIENEIIGHINKIIGESNIQSYVLNPYPLLDALSREITQYDEYNRYIVSSMNSGQLLDKLKSHVVSLVTNGLKEHCDEAGLLRARYIAIFLSAGIIDGYKEWYNNQSGMSLQELCKQFSNIILRAVNILNVDTNSIF